VVEVVSSLAIVLGAVALLRAGLQLAGLARPAARRELRVVESCALASRQRLHVVEVAGERLLVGVTEHGIALLRVLPAAAPGPEPVEAEAAAPGPRRRVRPWLRAATRGLLPLALTLLLGAAGAGAQAGGAEDAAAASPALPAATAPGPAALTLSLDGIATPEGLAPTLEVLAIVTLVAVAPSLLLMATCFTRILIVLAFLRQAIGVQHLPPNQVLVGLALFTTFFVMAPVAERMRVEAYEPYVARTLPADEAAQRALVPVRTYLMQFTRERDLDLFLGFSGAEPPADLAQVPLTTLLPAFMLSELRTAFEIGFMVYLPFLVIDLVISSMLISMGMIVLPPIVISLPFKLMLFVLLDGWHLVLGSLVDGLR
jgi:flagellar biosynthetic protein FliP